MVELELDFCALTYSVAPCAAVLGGTGVRKCYNTFGTCQDTANYTPEAKVYRFIEPVDGWPRSIDAYPLLVDVDLNPTLIDPGESLGKRATCSVAMRDAPHHDRGADKYVAERLTGAAQTDEDGYDPYERGTLFGKLRARNPHYNGRLMHVYTGYLPWEPAVGPEGQPAWTEAEVLANLRRRTYIIDGWEGPDGQGRVKIVGKDILKLADDDRATFPVRTTGRLGFAIDDRQTVVSIEPPGAVAAEYPASGIASVGQEVVGFDATMFNGVVFIETNSKTLRTYHFNGIDWFQINADFVIDAAGGIPALARLSDTDIAFIDGINDSLRRYHWNGSTWELVGSGLNISGVGLPAALARLSDTDVAFIDTGNDSLRRYHWNGSTWELVGSGLTVAFLGGSVALARLSDTDVAFIASTNELLQRYHWNGSTWELVGNSRFISSNTSAICEILDTEVPAFRLTRAQHNTNADPHPEGEIFQNAEELSGPPWEIIRDLLQDVSNVNPAFIPYTDWQSEGASFLPGFTLAAVIAFPTGARTLINEIVQQTQMYLWWDDIDQEIKLRILDAGRAPVAALTDAEHVLADTYNGEDWTQRRISRVEFYFGIINPAGALNDKINFSAVHIEIDAEAESADGFGDTRVLQVFSRWIGAAETAKAVARAQALLNRRAPVTRRIRFSLGAKDEALRTGDVFTLSHHRLQDDTGGQSAQDLQVIEVTENGDGVYEYEAIDHR
jgi:hypothetical protein